MCGVGDVVDSYVKTTVNGSPIANASGKLTPRVTVAWYVTVMGEASPHAIAHKNRSGGNKIFRDHKLFCRRFYQKQRQKTTPLPGRSRENVLRIVENDQPGAGTFATEIGAIPGTTKSNPAERGDYDSDQHSCMTLAECEHRGMATIRRKKCWLLLEWKATKQCSDTQHAGERTAAWRHQGRELRSKKQSPASEVVRLWRLALKVQQSPKWLTCSVRYRLMSASASLGTSSPCGSSALTIRVSEQTLWKMSSWPPGGCT
jgi:hypothetical protein